MKFYIFTVLLIIVFSVNQLLAQLPECPAENYTPALWTPPTFVPFDPPESPEVPPQQSPSTEDRTIFWVHGLGGTTDSWLTAANATQYGAPGHPDYPARKVQSVLPTYGTPSLLDAGGSLVNFTKSFRSTYEDNFIIAHSQGGLVSRKADRTLDFPWRQEERGFSGIVTFGTPHLGARILNSLNEGILNEFAEDACTSALSNEAFYVVDNYPTLLDLFIRTNKSVEQITCRFWGNMSSGALPLFLSELMTGVINEYEVGSPILDELDSEIYPTHKTSFVGIEYENDVQDNPVAPKQLLWRTLSLFRTASDGPVFSKDDDSELVNVANSLTDELRAHYYYWDAKVDNLQNWLIPCNFVIPNGACIALRNEYWNAIDKRNAFRNAFFWMLRVDDEWKGIIGALEYQTVPTCICTYDSPDDQADYVSYAPFITPTECASWNWSNGSESMYCEMGEAGAGVYKPSDGIVTAESAGGYPGAAAVIRMEETNHFQMRNSTKTKEALNKLLNGNAGDSWFYTKPR